MSLVAYYGAKPEALQRLIEVVQGTLGNLGPAFTPYRLEQVHATIIGLEGLRAPSGALVNANFLELRGETREMQLTAAFAHVRSCLPFTVQLGGFTSDTPYPFTSRGQAPALRAFSVQGSSAVAIGWPTEGSDYPPTLSELRRNLEPFGVLHKYHPTAAAQDNDLFCVMGRIDRARVSELAVTTVADRIRQDLARSRTELRLDASNLQVVSYIDPTLPIDSTMATPLTNADPATRADGMR